MIPGSDQDVNVPNLEQLVQLGIQTAKHGNKVSARVIFQQVLDSDPQNERALLWMAAVAEDELERLRYLSTVLRINPDNPTALKEMKKLEQKQVSNTSAVLVYGSIGLAIVLLLVALTVILLVIA